MMNPYEVLGIAQGATLSEIEEAYDALFDEYEPRAHEGDTEAIAVLNALNEARDELLDPDRRAKLDVSLAQATERETRKAERAVPPPRPKPAPAPPREQARHPIPPLREPSSRPQSRAGGGSSSVRTRRRGSYAITNAPPRRTLMSMLPFFAVILVLGFALAFGLTYLLTRGNCVPADLPTGATVATVNGVPIYQRDLDEREAIDKSGALSDPLFSAFFDPNTITGTRALDTLKFDSLDKLVNLEIIKQQAKKEGTWPTDEQQDTLVQQAAAGDQQPGETFEQMLCRLQISEAKYRRAVIDNVVYSVMANEHMPKRGSASDRTDGFIKWICDTRKNYDVKILLNFLVPDNPPCTSGLPSDLPLPGLDQTPVPEPQETAAVPIQAATATPATTVPAPNPTSAP